MTIIYYKKDQNQIQADPSLIIGGLALLALSGAVLLKYNGIREKDTPNIKTRKNFVRIIGDVVEVLER